MQKNLSAQSERFSAFMIFSTTSRWWKKRGGGGRALGSRDKIRGIRCTGHRFVQFMKGNSLDDVRQMSLQAEKKAGPLKDLP